MATLLQVIQKQFDRIFPIGAYFCAETATNPNQLLGFGTWEQLKDRMLVGVGDSFALSSVGGEINHTLTTAEIFTQQHRRVETWLTTICPHTKPSTFGNELLKSYYLQ